MGALPPERLAQPRDLRCTPRAASLLGARDNEAKSRLLDQLLAAFAEARENGDLAPINDVIEAWYRSVLLDEKGGEDLVEEMRIGYRQILEGEGGATLDDVRKRLNHPRNRPPRS